MLVVVSRHGRGQWTVDGRTWSSRFIPVLPQKDVESSREGQTGMAPNHTSTCPSICRPPDDCRLVHTLASATLQFTFHTTHRTTVGQRPATMTPGPSRRMLSVATRHRPGGLRVPLPSSKVEELCMRVLKTSNGKVTWRKRVRTSEPLCSGGLEPLRRGFTPVGGRSFHQCPMSSRHPSDANLPSTPQHLLHRQQPSALAS